MTKQGLSHIWVLAAALIAGGCGNDLDKLHEEVKQQEVTAQNQAAKRLSALDTRLEKSRDKFQTLIDELDNVEHPLKQSEDVAPIEFWLFRNDLVLLNAEAEQLLDEVGARTRRDAVKGFNYPVEALQECVHLHTYHSKDVATLGELYEIMAVPALDGLPELYNEAKVPQEKLYDAFGNHHFSDLDSARAFMDDYESKIVAVEQRLQWAEIEVAQIRGKLAGPFLQMWDKKITLDLGLDRCRDQYKKYKDTAALHGFVPK